MRGFERPLIFSRLRIAIGTVALLCLSLVGGGLLAAEHVANSAPHGKKATAAAKDFLKHCVRVYIHSKSNEGKMPVVGDFGEDLLHERATPLGGYWVDEKHVIVEDPVLQDGFVRDMAISLPNSDKMYPARISGRFLSLQALLLEVLPDSDGAMPEAFPLSFRESDADAPEILSYAWADGKWRIHTRPAFGAVAVADDGEETVEFTASGVLIDANYTPLGLAFGGQASLVEGDWPGNDLRREPFLDRKSQAAATARLQEQLTEAVLESRFRIRIRIEEEDDDFTLRDWTFGLGEAQAVNGEAEVRAPALVVGKRHLLVPVALPPEGIARIEEVTVIAADGRELPADYIGGFRDYMAVLIATGEDLPVSKLPPGFERLNPFAAPAPNGVADGETSGNAAGYFQRWSIDFDHGRRREIADYDRWLGCFRGFRGDSVVLTRTNERDGSLAFDVDGNLIAIALTPRLIKPGEIVSDGVITEAMPGFRPLSFASAKLSSPEAFDPTLLPIAEEQGQRLIDLGVEYQPLDKNSARLFHASRETRGGRIGLLVTHVYPGTIADAIGLREHDILLRMSVEDKSEPMELRSGGYVSAGAYEIADMASESFQSFLQFMPPPWPSRENEISTLLTAVGAGRKVILEYLREGEPGMAEFVTVYYDADYRSAKKERFPALGLTVKPITYEVARYFGRTDSSGVIVSKVDKGGKGAVAGLHHYLLITHVDGGAVQGLDDFRAKTASFEEGAADSVELTVEGFGKTRLVKIE